MQQPIYIFPFNGNGMEACECVDHSFILKGFIDDTPEKIGKSFNGVTVMQRMVLMEDEDAMLLAVPGSPTSFHQRNEIINSFTLPLNRFATVIHPSAKISPNAQIGKNVLIMAGAVITSNAVINNHVCVLPNSVIHHDSVIGEYTLVGSNVTIAGGTHIGKKCYIGSGSSIINGINIGDGCLVGIGTNVIHSFDANSKIVGNPARKL